MQRTSLCKQKSEYSTHRKEKPFRNNKLNKFSGYKINVLKSDVVYTLTTINLKMYKINDLIYKSFFKTTILMNKCCQQYEQYELYPG